MKILRFLVRWSVSGVLLQKIDKASLMKWTSYFLKTTSQLNIILYSDIKDFIQIIRKLLIEIVKNNCMPHNLNL